MKKSLHRLLIIFITCSGLFLAACQSSSTLDDSKDDMKESVGVQTGEYEFQKKDTEESLCLANEPGELNESNTEGQYEDELFIFYREVPYKRGIVKEPSKVWLLPTTNSNWVFDGRGFLVDVIAAAEVRESGKQWLLVHYTVWDALQTDMGWIPADCVLPYTENSKQYLLEPLTIADDANVLDFNTGKIQDASFVDKVFIIDQEPDPKLFPLSTDGYLVVGSIGGWVGVVERADLIYPSLESEN